jgi:pimeloyl-ACP methyl ester carboxylesterase
MGQGLYYESPVSHAVLGEYLASHGFVVATCPLVGTRSPLVRLDAVDLETQVRDMEFVMARIRREPLVSPERLGVFGFDMGGMAAVILAMRNPDVDAFVSVDSGILFGHTSAIPSGIPFTSPHFDPTHLRSPWLHATQREFASAPPGEEGSSLFDDAVHADRYLLLVDGMRHADFTSYALVQGREPIQGYWPPEQGGEKQSYEAVLRYVSSFLLAYLAGDDEGRAFLAGVPERTSPGVRLTVEHREPTPAGPVHADFLNALLAGEVERATEIAAAIHASHPDSPHLETAILARLGFHLLSSWEMSDEGVAVLRLNTELHSGSVQAWERLGDGYLWIDDLERAEPCYKKVLELEPDHGRARRILDWMESRPDD